MNKKTGNIWWLTGLSGAGKTTLGTLLRNTLHDGGTPALLIDGDALRAGVCSDLGFSAADRSEQTRRAAALAALVASQGYDAVVTLISPFARDRAAAREQAPGAFHEVFVSASLETCRLRDPKGLYQQVARGSVGQFTGISSPYEIPAQPDLCIDTSQHDVAGSFRQLHDYLSRSQR